MSELVQCLLDSGFTKSQLREYLPSGQELTQDNIDIAVDNLKRREGKRSQINLQAQAANIRLAERALPLLRPTSEGGAGMKPREIVKGMIVRDLRDRTDNLSVSGLALGYQAAMNMPLARAAEKLKPTLTGGKRDIKLMEDAFRVAGGGKAASNDAAVVGASLREAMDRAHKLLRESGADVGYIPNYLPQTHVAGKLRKAGPSVKEAQAKWKQDIWDRLDRDRITDWEDKPLNDTALEELLDHVFMSITTDGRSNITPPVELRMAYGAGGTGQLERILHFKTVDDSLWYSKAYGNDDLWGTFTNHLHGMAIDAAAHKVFGPQPEMVFANWRDWANKADPFNDMTELDHIWRNVVGFNSHGETSVSHIANSVRDLLSSAYMGSAVLASVSDVALTGLNAAVNNMNIGRMLGNVSSYAKQGDRELLNRTAGHIEYALSTLAASQRFEDTVGRGLTHRLADANYRMTGMTGWMNGLRHAWLSEFQTMLADSFSKPLDQLPKGVRSWLDTYGLANRWDEMRTMKTQPFGGKQIADFSSLEDQHLMAEVLGAVYTERDLAVLTPDGRTRALLNQGKAPGGAAGEILRSMTQFKTFPATMIMHGVWRYVFSKRLGSRTNRAAWTATMLVSMGILGGVAFQLREMAKGRDPRAMNTSDFWLRAFAQGGAVPGLAELFIDGQTRHSNGWLDTVLGPTGAVLTNTAAGAFNAAGAAIGVDGASDAAFKNLESASYMVPGGSAWYGRLFIQRQIRDVALDLADPDYSARQRRSERNRRNMFDQDMWWGFDDSPEAPALDEMFGGQ